MSEWISVKDKMPSFIEGKDYSQNVLAICIGYMSKPYISIFQLQMVEQDEDGHWAWAWARLSTTYSDLREAECEWDDDYQVTHWMPLPNPPEFP